MTPFGLSPSQTDLIKEILDQELAQSQSVQAWIFGSRARGTHRPYSDLDLLVECEPPLSQAQKVALIDHFEDSELPFKVDLVSMPDLLDAYSTQILAERALFWSKR